MKPDIKPDEKKPDIKYINFKTLRRTLNLNFEQDEVYQAHSLPSENMVPYIGKAYHDAQIQKLEARIQELEKQLNE